MRYYFTYLAVISLVLSSHFAKAQNMVNIDCPVFIDCLDGELTLADMTVWGDFPTAEVMNCGSTLRSQMNYKFEAKSKSITLELTYDDPDTKTFKLGIVTGCIPYGTCVAFQNCAFDSQPVLEIDDLVVGHEYVIFVDECGYENPFELVITPGSDDPFEAIVDINIDYNSCTASNPVDNQFCVDTPLEWTFEMEDESLYNTFSRQEATYHITIDGPESYDYNVDNYRNFNFEVTTPGEYILCLESVDLACDSYAIGICKDFSIGVIDLNYGTFEVCQHDLEEGLWVPDATWLGEPITEEGLYSFDYNLECDCPLNQSIEVIQLDEVVEELEFVLCPEDYPFVYFDDYIFDYSQFDIIEDLEIYEESLQRDYNNNKCDSLVHLVLLNEEPNGRCSSCVMPVSLEKSKIVYCIPFDNAAVDASGKANRVEAVGISFDDNGSTNNILWEAVFDGNNDYVSLPHIDDLNTSVFSFNFKFNKDELFENGDIESLMSKGDVASDNLRFEINLEKVNESIFDLVSTFYTPNGNVEIEMPDLQNFKWYDVAYVVETDSISLFLDGIIFDKVAVGENLRGNTENLYLGTIVNNSRTQFYNGRLDDFKYWKQKLSGQDVLFLHFPEKEFEVDQSYFLSCCEQAEFRDVVIDINNPLDSVIVPNASPTGYDSVYILNYIQADTGPEINLSFAPQDISVQYQQACQEFCQSQVDWTTDLSGLFGDNCGNVDVSQSHPFQVVLDENVSFVDILITGTDICGQTTSYTFGLELECLSSNVIDVPEQNAFEIISDGNCINEEEEVCIFSSIEIHPGFINQASNSLESYPDASGFNAVLSINGVAETFTSADIMNGIIPTQLMTEGLYTICLESVSNSCETITNNYCQTIKIRENDIVDHGEVITCREDIESSLPDDLSSELRNLILSNPLETTISVTEEDDCGCSETESITLIINDESIVEVSVNLCEGENFEGLTEGGTYTNTFAAANGCDSTRTVQLTVLENAEEFVFAEICDGETFQNYEEAGTYTEMFTATNGCDSTLIIELSVFPKSYTDVLVEICPDSMYLGLNQTGLYEFIDTNVFGCDSITTLNLNVLEEMDPECFVSSIENITKQIKIYPNPVSDLLTIDYDKNFTAIIYNVNGLLVNQVKSDNNKIDVSKLPNGIYFLQLKNNIETLAFKRFIKL